MNNQTKAYICGGTVILLWSTVAAVFKLSLRFLSPWQLLLYSASISLLILLFTVVVQKKLKSVFLLSRKEICVMFIQGLLNPFLYFILLFKSYDLLPAQEAQPITYTWPIMMVLLAWPLLSQRINLKDIIALVLCYLGIFIVITKGNFVNIHFSSIAGIVYAFLSTIVWALYWIVNARLKTDPVVTLFMNSLLSFPFVITACLLLASPFCPIKGIIGACYIGAFEMGVAFVFWLYSLKLAEKKSNIICLIYLSPVISLFFIQFLTGEKIIMPTLAGIVMILMGLFIQNSKKNKSNNS